MAKICIALWWHLTWFLELWYYRSLVSANDSVCLKPIWEVLTWTMDMEVLGRGLEFARRRTVSDEKST